MKIIKPIKFKNHLTKNPNVNLTRKREYGYHIFQCVSCGEMREPQCEVLFKAKLPWGDYEKSSICSFCYEALKNFGTGKLIRGLKNSIKDLFALFK